MSELATCDEFAFYATVDSDSLRPYMPPSSYLLPATSWYRKGFRKPNLPAHVTDVAADCGGFVATFKWGDYRFTPWQYREWLSLWKPSWAATMDYCCEDEITSGKPGIVRERQIKSTRMAELFFDEFRDAPFPWVPTVQGWEVEDYRRHARELAPLIGDMAAHYGAGSGFRVGVGTICRRASPALIDEVVETVREELPGVPLHLWGVKLSYLQKKGCVPEGVLSVDSAAWNGRFGRDLEQYKNQPLTQREYAYHVALPSYLNKVSRAIGKEVT